TPPAATPATAGAPVTAHPAAPAASAPLVDRVRTVERVPPEPRVRQREPAEPGAQRWEARWRTQPRERWSSAAGRSPPPRRAAAAAAGASARVAATAAGAVQAAAARPRSEAGARVARAGAEGRAEQAVRVGGAAAAARADRRRAALSETSGRSASEAPSSRAI